MIAVAFLRSLSERKRLGIVHLAPEDNDALHMGEVTGGDHLGARSSSGRR